MPLNGDVAASLQRRRLNSANVKAAAVAAAAASSEALQRKRLPSSREVVNKFPAVHNRWPSASSAVPLPAGEMRNDLYVALEKGEFEKGGKSVAKNVEITVYVLDLDGQILKVGGENHFSCREETSVASAVVWAPIVASSSERVTSH